LPEKTPSTVRVELLLVQVGVFKLTVHGVLGVVTSEVLAGATDDPE
jgi:hypothetical protein